MIKIKVFRLLEGEREIGNNYYRIADYIYCVYLFGILIHSVTLYGINIHSEEMIFGNKIIKSKKNHG